MEQSTANITRRLFNGIIAALTFLGFGKSKTEAHTECLDEYMEVFILPKDFKHPYSAKTKEIMANHIRAGKSKQEIKQWILKHSEVIRIPIK